MTVEPVLVESDRTNLNAIPYSKYRPNQYATKCTSGEYMRMFPQFTYNINEYGFRYNIPKGSNILVASGCSITFGQGLAQDTLYPELVAKKLDMECVNVALPGTGPEIQILNASWAVTHYKPKMLLFYMSALDRTFFATERGFVNYCTHWESDILSKDERIYHSQIFDKFYYGRIMDVAWRLYSLFELCKVYGTSVYFRCWEGTSNAKLLQFLSGINDMPDMKNIDKARDNSHHGVQSHDDFSIRILDVINA